MLPKFTKEEVLNFNFVTITNSNITLKELIKNNLIILIVNTGRESEHAK